MIRRDIAVFVSLLLAAGAMFLPGIGWGLPSSAVNPYLFGGQTPWSGARILQLAGPTEDPARGADVASHFSPNRQTRLPLNENDEQRARIIRRYRLMSYQPDEWNTLKALSEMKPSRGNFDPKLYQYGGLWVYPVGILLKGASLLHLIDLRPDVTWYLDHPGRFGRFYVVARLYSALWGCGGVILLFLIVRRIIGGTFFPAMAALCFISMPVVVNLAHEAKPHLAGAVLMLAAAWAGSNYVERGNRAAWLAAGGLCGAAVAMVLSSLPIFCIVPAMVLLRPGAWKEKIGVCGGALAMGILIYLIADPYVAINFCFHRELLRSNLGNSRAMYEPHLTAAGLGNAIYLIAAGMSPLLALCGGIGAAALGIRAWRARRDKSATEIRRRSMGLLLALPALCVIGQCVLLATNKPAEFGRFLVMPDIVLMIEAMAAAATPFAARGDEKTLPDKRFQPPLRRPVRKPVSPLPAYSRIGRRDSLRRFLVLLLLLTTVIPGLIYLRGFARDSRPLTSRLQAADRLQQLNAAGSKSLAVFADPAPYCLPPVDLFRWNLFLSPDGHPSADVSIDRISAQHFWKMLTATPISWADVKYEIRVHRGT